MNGVCKDLIDVTFVIRITNLTDEDSELVQIAEAVWGQAQLSD